MLKISATLRKINLKNTIALTAAVLALSAFFVFIAFYQQNNAGTASANSVVTAGIPTVTSTVPSQNAYGVTAGTSVTVNFSEAIDQSTVNSSTFRVISNQTGVHSAGTFNFTNGDTTVEFVPTNSLDQAGEKVTVILTTGIQSSSTSQALGDFYIYEFTIATTGGTNAFERISTTKFNNNQGLDPRPSRHLMADITGDGDLDLILSNFNRGLETWVGDGDGTISSPQDIVPSVSGLALAGLVAGPMDNNDSIDIVFKHAQNDLRVYLNNGSGSFPSQMTVNRMGNQVDVGPLGIGDFNGDGLPDVVSSAFITGNVLVFFNNGGTSLDYNATYVVGTGTQVGAFEIGDFDGDYDLDITDGLYLLTNDGTGSFSVSGPQAGISGSARSVASAPFIPGDTFLHRIQSMSGSGLQFLDNNGSAVFTASSISHDLSSVDAIAPGDFDGDGDPDFVVAETFPTSGKMQTLENVSVGSQSFLRPFSPQYMREETETIEAGDLNNDGILDLVSSVDDSGGADLPGFSIWLGLSSVADEFTGGEMTFLGGSDRDGSGDPGGTFVISQHIADDWQVVHQRSFDVEYSTQEMKIVPNGRTVKLRIVQETIPFADVDRVGLRACGQDLSPQYAIYTENGQDLKDDLDKIDHNVVIAHEKEIEISWKTPFFCRENAVLSLTANEYGHASHLTYPQGGDSMTYNLNSIYRSIDVDGLLAETDEKYKANYEAFWQPVTGHPDGYTYIYVSNDDSSLNVALDITMDNTDELGEDWAELVFDHASGEKTYRIDDYDDTYGKCGFGRTSKVSYKHQTCEFSIPLSELPGYSFSFKLKYYGTGGGGPIFSFDHPWRGQAITVDSSGDIYVTGLTESLAFPTTAGVVDTTGDAGGDAYVTKINGDLDTLVFSTYLGGSAKDYGNDIEIDSSGNIYVGGVTESSNFPSTGNGTYEGMQDVFLTILNSTATSVTYSTIIGGERKDVLGEMQLYGATPVVYLAGQACGGTSFTTNYPTTTGAHKEAFNNAGDVCVGFLSVLNSSLSWPSALTYSTYFGGEPSASASHFYEGAMGLDIDSSGRAHMAGHALDTDDFTAGAYDTSNDSFGDGYYTVINPVGGGSSDLNYRTYIGDDFEEARAMDIVLDSNEDAIIVGETNFELDDVTTGFISDYGNFFMVKISPDGAGAADLLYATMLPETDIDNEALSLAIDSSDRVYIVGKADEIQTTPNAMIESANDNDDPWFAIIDPSGNGQQDLIYSTYLSDGSSNDFAQDVVLDSNNRVYVTGTTFSGDFLGSFPFANSVYDDTFNGDRDVFIGSFATSFTTTPGGGAPPPSPGIQRFPTLGTPQIGPVEVLSDSKVKFNWTYAGDTPQSFSLLGPEGSANVADIPGSDRDAVEEGLPHNTSIEGRKVAAYLSGAQKVSQEFPPAVTHMPPVTPLLESRNGVLTVAIEQQLNNLDLGQSGIQFESMTLNNEVQGTAVQQSDWIQDPEYTFEDYDPTMDTQVRVRARNQEGVETEWSQYILIPGQEEEAAEVSLGISMSATTIGGAPIPRPVDPNSIIFVNITVSNAGPDTASNVFMNLPIPQFMTFVPGSLRVSGEIQTDSPDEDLGQGSRGSVSVIWPELEPDNPQNVSFQLRFNVEELRGNAIAAANPVLVLIASVNSENAPNPVFTPPIEVEPDVAVVSPPPPPPPVPPTPPTPPAQTPPTPAPAPSPAPAPPAAPGPPPQELFLTSQVESEDEMLEFTGTTSEPNSTVTVTLNNILTLQVTSDENGVWQTFVSASQLGIEPGETADVQVDSIAEKDGVISNSVSSTVTVTRGIAGEVVAEVPKPVVSQSAFEQVAEVVEESKEEIQTSLAVAAPIAIASSAPLLGYIPYLPTLLYHFFTWLIGLFRKKEEREIFGTVYDSITKEPLKLAIVRVFNKDTGKLIATEVTNNQGKYDLLLEPGNYRLEVKKPQYNFPSKIVRKGPDAEYQNIYVSDEGFTVTQEEIGVPDVPVDPVNAEAVFRISGFFKKGLLALQKVGSHLALPVLLVGSAISAFTTAIIQSDPINWVLVIVYIFMLGLQLLFRSKPERAWGVVYEAVSNEPLPLATLQLIEPEFGKVVKSRLSDYQGRYSFAPEPGKYVLKAAKPGFEQVEVVEEARKGREPITGELEVEKPEQRITGDIAMRQSGQA